MTTPPLLSICIPTRNRAFYLDYCLRTILAQDFTDYEIIVAENSDPAGREETRRILERLDRSRIVYFEQPQVVSMTDNYESALARTRGEYCLCLGDDDGIVAGSLSHVATVLKAHQPVVLKSPSVSYFWPGSHWHPQSALYLAVANPLMWVDSKSMLVKVAAFETPYYFLPMIYYAFVHRSVIDGIVAHCGSFFADTTSIDLYSGMVVAANTKSYLICDRPFAIAGQSPKSNGVAFLEKQNDTIAEEYNKQHSLHAQYAKYKLPFNRSLEVLTLMELMRAVERFPDTTGTVRLDKLECFRRCCGLTGTYLDYPVVAERRQAVFKEFQQADPSTDWAKAFAELESGVGRKVLYPRGELHSFMATKEIGYDVVKCPDVEVASRIIARFYDGIPLDLGAGGDHGPKPMGGSKATPSTNSDNVSKSKPKSKPAQMGSSLRYFVRHPGKALCQLCGFLGRE